MGKIYAEEHTFHYLKNESRQEALSAGLILGQYINFKYYVCLLVRTPEQLGPESQISPAPPANFNSVSEINESWIADHAKHITKMLPGGLIVLGIFICSPNKIFSNNAEESKIKSVLSLLRKQLSNQTVPCGNNQASANIVLHFNTINFECNCVIIDFNKSNTFETIIWEFHKGSTKWCQIQCKFDLSYFSIGGNMSHPVKEQLQIAVKEIWKSLEKAIVVLGEQSQNLEGNLENLLRHTETFHAPKTINNVPLIKANVFLPCKRKLAGVHGKNCDVELHLLGVLASEVYLNQETTIEEAISAVKQDIIRSLLARFEMHWDSLVEEEYGSPEEKLSVHEPPHRVSVLLPQGNIAVSDYLFPGEGVNEIISSFKEMLDITICESNLGKEVELQGDPMDVCDNSSEKFLTTSATKIMELQHSKGVLLILSFTVVVIAIFLTLFISK